MLPVAQYPEITPPTVQVTCTYPGASSKVVAETVAAPIEQQVIGVENMLYMSSQCTNDGGYNLTVTFEVGTNLDMAQVLVQNRVNLALPTLPSEVKQTGVSVKKKSPSILLVVNLISPKGTYDQLYLSNYATIQIRDELAQIKGVGDVTYLGQLDYSMRAWLDPERMAARDLSASDVVAALREQNVQVAAGSLGRPPVPQGQAFQYTLSTLGRLTDPEQFGNIVVKTGDDGRAHPHARPGDRRSQGRSTGATFGGIQLGAKIEDTSCSLDGQPSIGLGIFQQPGSNALDTAEAIRERMDELKRELSAGRGLRDRLRHDAVHRRIDPRSLQGPPRRHHSGGDRGAGVPAVVAGDAHSADRRARGHRRHVCGDAGTGLQPQQSVAVRPGAGDRHRGGRRDRRRRGGRASPGAWPVAQGSRPQGDERSHRADHRHLARADVRVHSVCLHLRHHRPVLPPVRPDDRRLDVFLGGQLADAQPGALRPAAQGQARSSAIR